MLQAFYYPYQLVFKQPGGTSRGVLTHKDTYFIVLKNNQTIGIGESALFKGLSVDDKPDYEEQLQWLCQNIHLPINTLLQSLQNYPSIQFGLETAWQSLQAQHPCVPFPSAFTQSQKAIPINGLIWMGTETSMKQQIQDKLNQGFTVIKLKIGAIEFEKELALLHYIRKHFSASDIEIRVDANGAFKPSEALYKLQALSPYHIHSIEQPIAKGQPDLLAQLCQQTPIPIALDEELIGILTLTEKQNLLQTIKPQYIILKPALVGGFTGANQWITLAEQYQIGWWITSALESNIGLNAIAQWTYTLGNSMPQGLGTGGLFVNNFSSPLQIDNGHLHYTQSPWEISSIVNQITNVN